MKINRTYTVNPYLPSRLEPLREMAYNLFFSWNNDLVNLFVRLDTDLWFACNRNPAMMISRLKQERVEEILNDESFLAQMDRIYEEFKNYVTSVHPYSFKIAKPVDFTIAYFSAEFGLAECLPIYSGGLGILSGDHLKSASDLNIPLVGVGLLYQEGYFRQYLNSEGWQQEIYADNDFYHLPITLVRDQQDQPLKITVNLKGKQLSAQIWQIKIGRTNLYLLDTNIEDNEPDLRKITAQLYGGDLEMRIKQEILLGIGGVRALAALGIESRVFHMNEGHSAFAGLERLRMLREQYNLSFDVALETVIASSVFTTHTPVPAGNDVFPSQMIESYFSDYVRNLGISMPVFLGLGRQNPWDKDEGFCMTVLALRTSAYHNGVSRLHASISRKLWSNVYPEIPVDDVPISHITNGVHIPTWISQDMAELFNRYLGPKWIEDPDNQRVWARVMNIPDSELWRTHERHRERLVAFARDRLGTQLARRGASRREIETSREVLSPETLTIGFARRFASYKRGSLIFKDLDRLAQIFNNEERPVQMIIAGKAHPADNSGKEVIKEIVQFARQERFRKKIVFLEDYDIHVARHMLRGCDVWLNNPRRPLEACGTSGMKAVANGVLHLSIMDGWWDEGFQPENGWAIGSGEEYKDAAYQDEVESRAIYDLLEKEIAPMFYHRSGDNLPRTWIERMKMSMRTLCVVFNSHRMLEEYMENFYYNAAEQHNKFMEDNFAVASQIADWKQKIMYNWEKIRIENTGTPSQNEWRVGEEIPVEADLFLGELQPDDISVDVYTGVLDPENNFKNPKIFHMTVEQKLSDGHYRYKGDIKLQETGRFGMAVRVIPYHNELINPYSMRLILWA